MVNSIYTRIVSAQIVSSQIALKLIYTNHVSTDSLNVKVKHKSNGAVKEREEHRPGWEEKGLWIKDKFNIYFLKNGNAINLSTHDGKLRIFGPPS